MKKICFFAFFLLSITIDAFSAEISSYEEMVSAMQSGQHFVIILKMPECINQPPMPIGYFVPSKMILAPATNENLERLVTSHLVFTDYTGVPAYEYTKYTFNADETVMVRSVLYDPLTFKQIGNHVITCAFSKGIYVYTSAGE